MLALVSLLSSLSLSHLVVGCADDSASGDPGLTFNACAPLEIAVGASSSAQQMQGIADALAMWNQQAGTALTSIAVASPAPEPSSGPDTALPMVPLIFQVAAPPFHGFYDAPTGTVFINQDLTDVAALHITVAHEIGHAFGLSHVAASARASLMNPGNTTVGLTPTDVDALAALWGRCSR